MQSGVKSVVQHNTSADINPNQASGASQYARVFDVLLTDSKSDADKFGVPPGSIGAILFKFLTKGVEDSGTALQKALPVDARVRTFPVKNEIVEIILAPTKESVDARTNTLPDYYYRSVVDLWGSSEHNARPNDRFNTSKDQVTGNFVEKGDVGRLLHLPGDFVLEGRFGNAIRVGSSNNKTSLKSPWRGPDSSPLVIISNNNKSSKLSFEEINKDGSSMYILSDQTIPFEPASLNFESYEVNMRVVQQEQVIKTSAPEPVQPAAVSQAVLPEKESVVTQTEQKPLPPPVVEKDAVEELPNKEPVTSQVFQEYENERVLHIGEENAYWRDMISETPTTNFSVPKITGNISDVTLVYLGFQQGIGGIQAILDSAIKGQSSVPLTNPFASGAPIQSRNMPNNVGKDFRGVPLTPANFISYWQKKVEQIRSVALSTPMPSEVSSAIKLACAKWGVSEDLARVICYIESKYNSNIAPISKSTGTRLTADKATYYGLFQVSQDLWRDRYPKEPLQGRANPIKNADVGVKYIKTAIDSLARLKRLIK